jgi:hypothetical protein
MFTLTYHLHGRLTIEVLTYSQARLRMATLDARGIPSTLTLR